MFQERERDAGKKKKGLNYSRGITILEAYLVDH